MSIRKKLKLFSIFVLFHVYAYRQMKMHMNSIILNFRLGILKKVSSVLLHVVLDVLGEKSDLIYKRINEINVVGHNQLVVAPL